MPDWERVVAGRLAESTLPPDVKREVTAEIAEHLDDCYRELADAGRPDPEIQTLAQVPDWRMLGRKIRQSKEDRMAFAKKVVMPGIAAIIVMLAAFKFWMFMLITPEPCGPAGIRSLADAAADVTCIMFSATGPAYLPWLATLLPAAALAAGLSRWMGGRSVQRLLAAVCPALYLAAEVLVMSVLGAYYWRIPIYFVLAPAIVCAIGALPFLSDRREALAA